MTTTDLTESDGGMTTVVIARKFAWFVANDLMYRLESDLEGLGFCVSTPQQEHAIRDRLDYYERFLGQLAWGDPEGDVSFTAPRALLDNIGRELMDSDMHATANARDGMTEQQTRR